MSKGSGDKTVDRRAQKLSESFNKQTATQARNKKQHLIRHNLQDHADAAESIAAPGSTISPAVTSGMESIAAPTAPPSAKDDAEETRRKQETGSWKVAAHNMRRRLRKRKRKAYDHWNSLFGDSGHAVKMR